MPTVTYLERREQLETYFDRTAAEAWSRMTSDAPLGRIRTTVREGRARMRNTLLSWLPDDLSGARILDAGCGTGALATEAARRGADVLAIDLSPTLIGLARQRTDTRFPTGNVTFEVGDMLSAKLGRFDYIVAMDSLIHYSAGDMARILGLLASRSRQGVLFTFVPRTPALALMHMVGRLFPRKDRAPAVEPTSPAKLRCLIAEGDRLGAWRTGRTKRVSHGFYTSEALELTH
ncbi:MAG: magnesium protoporphyrin IX methyltransferase [Pseudomonadota bacterium]